MFDQLFKKKDNTSSHHSRPAMSEVEINANKALIRHLLKSTNRAGMEKVLEYLDAKDFYAAPSSSHRHHNWRGGLAQHSIDVFKTALSFDDALPADSVIITGLLHDIYKAGKYFIDSTGVIRKRTDHPKGHGRRSILLLQELGLTLTEDERLAIRWHAGGNSASEEDAADVEKARLSPLWKAINRADTLNSKQHLG